MSMYETIGTNNPTYLLADPQGADVIAIPCKAGNGTVARGTVMFRESNGEWSPAATGDIVATNMLAVIDESVNTATGAKHEDARAFRAARLIHGKVKLKDGTAITAAHAVVLRAQGIVFDQMKEDA